MILDGWGIGEKGQQNPFIQVPTPTFDWLKANFPFLALQASGVAVGLPWGSAGDSEAGHLTLGTGRIVWQHYPRITNAIKDGSFFANQALRDAFQNSRAQNKKVHFVGLVSSANSDSSFEHLLALLELARTENISPLIHCVTDGRESGPRDALAILPKLEAEIKKYGMGRIASVSGRFYALDRDERWERTDKVFWLLTGGGKIKNSYREVLEEAYGRDLTDEFVEPSLVGTPEEATSLTITPGDSVIFFNFREDNMRQLVLRFTQTPEFFVATFTQYDENLPVAVAFPPETVQNPLGKVLSDAGKRQLRLAESPKAAHVTHFFNGHATQPFPGEYWISIPSPAAARIEEHPELGAIEIQNRLVEAMEEGVYDFILVNFANPDLIAHTRNFEAALRVIGMIDRTVNHIANAALKLGAPLIITSDHGNIEQMRDPSTARPETLHNTSPVPFHLVDQRFSRPRAPEEIEISTKEIRGSLADVAPTILELMEIPRPAEMTGNSLLKLCQ